MQQKAETETKQLEVKFIDDIHDENHRPHHIYHCTCNMTDSVCLAKENSHHEGEKLQFYHQSPLDLILPKFYGIYVSLGLPYMIIEDLDAGFKSPCHCDIKLGTRQWEIGASDGFRVKLIRKNEISISRFLGIRLVSILIQRNKKIILDTSKSQNCYISKEQFIQQMRDFIPPPHLLSFIQQLIKINCVFSSFIEANPGFRIYASSLFMSYDGDDLSKEPRLGLIDFAHSHFDIRTEGYDINDANLDDGVELGLRNLLEIVKSFVPDPNATDYHTYF
ncbi:Inositol polyphosphate kinase family protein [Histomonas meleagridis]|uniref:Inositol polyphosphate kinase family protein n=1 Tax=Histomonas meleagridis TaxID=135588 RepID=UPI00355A7FF5|nr:Inositol polyphosphate kinase family protein [Histomonas meleagridis]KAH0798332.1 Inositol polyphosphate kinase family protein [Histomonas meleagridis]